MSSRLGRAFARWSPLALLCLAAPALARTGYPLLLFEPDARSAARGESTVALARGLDGIFHQPAALAGQEGEALGLVYVDHLQDMRVVGTTWGGDRFAPWHLGVGLLRLDYGDLQGLDDQGNATGSFEAGETLLLAGVARRLPDQWGGRLTAGAQAGWLGGAIEDASSHALLLNLGLGWEREQLALGLAARNFGRVLSDYGAQAMELPATVEAGAAWRLAHLPFTWTLGWQKIRERDPFVKLGGELLMAQRWRLGLGYHVERGDERLAGVSGESNRGFSLGVGGQLPGGMDLQWSWSSWGELGALNRLSLAWRYRP
ncbi:MAG: PorV/PorQ family protein [bacterium]|nr:PorV/PorQ family protein [bacterium]